MPLLSCPRIWQEWTEPKAEYSYDITTEATSQRFPSCIFTEAAEHVTNVSQQEGWSPRTAVEDTQAIKPVAGSIQTTALAARGENSTLKLWNRCRSWQPNRAVALTSTIFLYEYKSQKHLCWKLPLTSNFSTSIPWDEVQMRTWLAVNPFICRTCLADKVLHYHLERRKCQIDLIPVESKIQMMRGTHCGFVK